MQFQEKEHPLLAAIFWGVVTYLILFTFAFITASMGALADFWTNPTHETPEIFYLIVPGLFSLISISLYLNAFLRMPKEKLFEMKFFTMTIFVILSVIIQYAYWKLT
jgi:hypothetical protein